ncbi:MAG: alpha/beta hydrolase [Candidatus Lokiarchaeota archaeon]|nr:alpha/beta hydrolase [Candidatus Lokiarchaeota archaeon]
MARKLDRGAVWCIAANVAVGAVLCVYLGIAAAGVRTEDKWIHPSSPLDWTAENGTVLLHGRLYTPPFFDAGAKYPSILLFHGVTRTLDDLDDTARQLAMKGCVCFSISFHGHGLSEGTFPTSDGARYNESFGDAAGAYRWLQAQPFVNPARVGAIGQSMGGGAAIYLALQDLAPAFVAWYPATAYAWIDTPLYECTSNSSSFKGFIIQGTDDTCSRCLPNYTQHFVDGNAGKVDLYWVEGGVHGATPVDYPLYVEGTAAWWASTWQLQDVLPFPPIWLYAAYIGGGVLAIVVVVDVLVLACRAIKKRRARSLNQEAGSGGQPIHV